MLPGEALCLPRQAVPNVPSLPKGTDLLGDSVYILVPVKQHWCLVVTWLRGCLLHDCRFVPLLSVWCLQMNSMKTLLKWPS
jgi:hypothetical protein